MSVGPHEIAMAPLRGVTVATFRRVFAARFRGVDWAMAPFIPLVSGRRVRPSVLADLDPGRSGPLPLVPQVIGRDPDALRVMLSALADRGFRRVDLNAGCPWPFVVRKGRGAGLLADPDALRRLLDAGCELLPGGLSVKVRLGIERDDLLAQRLDLFNAYPLAGLTIHPRTARQMYGGEVRLDVLEALLPACRHAVTYSGDLRSPDDFARLRQRFPSIRSWMIGRGLVADPFLAERLAGAEGPRDLRRLADFVAAYAEASREELHGPSSFLGRMKEFWSYLHRSLAGGDRLWKALRICRTVAEYQAAVSGVFDHLQWSDYRLRRVQELPEDESGVKPPPAVLTMAAVRGAADPPVAEEAGIRCGRDGGPAVRRTEKGHSENC
jgi:tRNA-dihydrouridine synthase